MRVTVSKTNRKATEEHTSKELGTLPMVAMHTPHKHKATPKHMRKHDLAHKQKWSSRHLPVDRSAVSPAQAEHIGMPSTPLKEPECCGATKGGSGSVSLTRL